MGHRANSLISPEGDVDLTRATIDEIEALKTAGVLPTSYVSPSEAFKVLGPLASKLMSENGEKDLSRATESEI